MKLFNSNRYTKEGKGIDKDKPEKKPFFKFWEIVWLKRFKLVALNFMYFIPNLIAAALAGLSYFTATSLFYTLSNQKSIAESAEAAENTATILGTEFGAELFNKMLLFIIIFFTVLPVFAVGPFQSGMTYILRCFTKREPCFLWTDYISKTRSNLKLSIQAAVINAVAGFFIILDFSVYFALFQYHIRCKGRFPRLAIDGIADHFDFSDGFVFGYVHVYLPHDRNLPSHPEAALQKRDAVCFHSMAAESRNCFAGRSACISAAVFYQRRVVSLHFGAFIRDNRDRFHRFY